ncbi:hypothetical protein N7468_003276 [Penicillium chermesinum]|uniref:Uncharacterized protein n=1 Tax=Penicillium chermesinum TaxID=63820 RepID=A0A9W9TRN7_9EURO|nr:uncharacterized protein N7468_003276 [Penicillium chermesinum]KAJ5238657.1 hypothetical protein N7468_003276 [Penicillium chermesinum]
MPHHHHADMMMRHHHVERQGVPSEPLSDLFPTPTSIEADLSVLVPRSDSTCGGQSCEKPASNLETTVLPVVLGAGVPIICAIVVLIILHRRHVKKLMREDANDKHKSLDFGLDPVGPPRRNKAHPGTPQMMEPAHGKGLSLDIAPYLMPPGLHGSRDSLSSVARSIDDDKYRPATFLTHDNASVRSFPRNRDDASKMRSGYLARLHRGTEAPPAQMGPPSPQNDADLGVGANYVAPEHEAHDKSGAAPEPEFHLDAPPTLNFEAEPHQDHAYDRPNFPLPEAPAEAHTTPSTQELPRISLPASDITSSDYGDDHRKSQFVIPEVNVHGTEEHVPLEIPEPDKSPEYPEEPQNLDSAYVNPRDTRRLTLGVRPLPPEDPSDNPEQRANRIRSFYKEYFDDSKRETTYYEDYDPEFYDGGYVYDPATGEYFDAAAPLFPTLSPSVAEP